MKSNYVSDEHVSDKADGFSPDTSGPPRVSGSSIVSLTCACCGVTFQRFYLEVKAQEKKGQTKFYCSNRCVGRTHGRTKQT